MGVRGFAVNRITLEPGTTKNREGRVLPIYGELREWLLIERQLGAQYVQAHIYFFAVAGSGCSSASKLMVESAVVIVDSLVNLR